MNEQMTEVIRWVQSTFGTDFWANFWPNFFADLAVGVGLTGLISWLYTKSKKANAEVSIYASHPEENKLRLNFEVKNTGKVNFASNEIYWTVYAEPDFFTQHPQIETVPIDGKLYRQYSGATQGPVFPNHKLHIFSLELWPIPQQKVYNFYCVLTTVHGYFPKKATPSKKGKGGYNALQKITFTISPD